MTDEINEITLPLSPEEEALFGRQWEAVVAIIKYVRLTQNEHVDAAYAVLSWMLFQKLELDANEVILALESGIGEFDK